MNAFTRGGERVYRPWKTHLHEEANVFTRGGKHVYISRGTHLREEANAFALYLASERSFVTACERVRLHV